MPLTPADVRNKQFSTTRLRPGYDEEEVDAFLDEVEAELDRLLQENEELRAKLAELLRGGKSAVPALSSPLSDPKPDMMAPESRVEPERRQPEPVMMGGMPHIEDNMDTAARVLSLAQQTADQAIADARREADDTLGRARREADDVLTKARRGPGRKAWSATRRSGTVRRWARWSRPARSLSAGLMTCARSSASTAAGSRLTLRASCVTWRQVSPTAEHSPRWVRVLHRRCQPRSRRPGHVTAVRVQASTAFPRSCSTLASARVMERPRASAGRYHE